MYTLGYVHPYIYYVHNARTKLCRDCVIAAVNDNFCFFVLKNELSLRFELTGGFIKNAVLSALSIAVSREGDNPVVCQEDLLSGANLQLRGRLKMKVSFTL